MTILEIVKTLLKIVDDTQDALLSLYIDIVVQQILNYTNLRELPTELEYEAAMMTVDMFNEMSGANAATGKATSISEAGRSVSFDTAQATLAAEQRIKDRQTQLDRFKQLYAFR